MNIRLNRKFNVSNKKLFAIKIKCNRAIVQMNIGQWILVKKLVVWSLIQKSLNCFWWKDRCFLGAISNRFVFEKLLQFQISANIDVIIRFDHCPHDRILAPQGRGFVLLRLLVDISQESFFTERWCILWSLSRFEYLERGFLFFQRFFWKRI